MDACVCVCAHRVCLCVSAPFERVGVSLRSTRFALLASPYSLRVALLASLAYLVGLEELEQTPIPRMPSRFDQVFLGWWRPYERELAFDRVPRWAREIGSEVGRRALCVGTAELGVG